MASKMEREITFSMGTRSDRSTREIQRSGEAAKPAAEVQGALSELFAKPTKKRFVAFLKEAKVRKVDGLAKAEEIKKLLGALNSFKGKRRLSYKAIGEIIDGMFSVYGGEVVVRFASSFAAENDPLSAARLLFLLCVCSENEVAAKYAFAELRDVYRTYGNGISFEGSFEESARVIADNARASEVKKMANEAILKGDLLA